MLVSYMAQGINHILQTQALPRSPSGSRSVTVTCNASENGVSTTYFGSLDCTGFNTSKVIATNTCEDDMKYTCSSEQFDPLSGTSSSGTGGILVASAIVGISVGICAGVTMCIVLCSLYFCRGCARKMCRSGARLQPHPDEAVTVQAQ